MLGIESLLGNESQQKSHHRIVAEGLVGDSGVVRRLAAINGDDGAARLLFAGPALILFRFARLRNLPLYSLASPVSGSGAPSW